MELKFEYFVIFFSSLTITTINAFDKKRKIVQIPGDLVLGGLFPMHEQVSSVGFVKTQRFKDPF